MLSVQPSSPPSTSSSEESASTALRAAVLAAAQVLKGRIYHVHLKDTFTGGEDCFPLGQGNAPLGALIRQLKEDGYPEMLSVEFEYNGDPTTGLKESLSFIQHALA